MRWALVLVAALLPPEALSALDEPDKSVAVVDTKAAESKAADLDAFKAWFKSVGGTATHLQIVDTGARGLGVEARADIQEGDELITIPVDTILCRRTILDRKTSEMRGISPQGRSSLSRIPDDHDLLVLLLIRERALGEESFYAPYIKILPQRALPLVLTMTDKRQKEWLDEATYHRAKAEKNKQINRHKRLRDQLKDLLVGMDGGMEQEKMDEHLSLEVFAWADGLIKSRALTLAREGKFLVPFADMMNYAPHPEARTRDHGKFFKKYHRVVGGTFMIMADRYTAENGEVLEDYGDNDSELYFHSFGFVPQMNPFDCVTVRLPAPKIVSKQRKLVAKLRVALNPEACVRPERPLPDQHLYHLYLLAMTEDHADECMERVTANPELGAMDCFTEEKGFTPEIAWKKFIEIITEQLEPDPKKKVAWEQPKEKKAAKEHNDASEVLHAYAPKPSTMQKLTAVFTASRRDLLRVLLESPPPKVKALEEAPSIAKESDKSANDDLKALNELIYESTQKYLGALRAAREVGAHSCNQTWPDSILTLLGELQTELGGALALGDGDAAGGDASAQCANEEKGANASEDAVAAFNAWFVRKMGTQRPVRVRATRVPGLRFGVVATEAIAAEEVYLAVPPSAIMDRESAAKSELGDALDQVRVLFGRGDAFHELLLHLWYELYVKKDNSDWWPYLRLLPSAEELGAPHFCDDAVLEAALSGSALLPVIRAHRQEIRAKYDQVMVPIIDKIPFFQNVIDKASSYRQYEWASLILNSRSIWWQAERHLVPMLDFVNCRAAPPGASEAAAGMRVHSTKADADKFAVTNAPVSLAEGDQIFENYGQPNYIYFLYHGFILEQNPHDCYRWDFDGQTHCLSPTQGVEEKVLARVGESTGRDGRSVLVEDLTRRLQLYPKAGAPASAAGREAVAYAFAASEQRLLTALLAQLEQAERDSEEM